ncbi:nucleoside diphosphate kinase 6-like [Prorops nasuta]|uniref:nucleoside diphosphate kinase 6-like n=1 Tax=Prorops nasuta TaxID=863751 RepID=UPI0034CFCD2C
MHSSKSLELTLAILKPHIVKSPFALKNIHNIIIQNEFKVVRTRKSLITHEEASKFYAEHINKFFYNRLLTFMCSGPSLIHILARHNAINTWRQLMGPTKVYVAQLSAPNTIRGTFGLSDTRNATHGSDSQDSAEREIAIFFKDFDIKKWYADEEMYFNTGQVKFDFVSFVHNIAKNTDIYK